MDDLSKLTLDVKKGKIFFNGNCLEVLKLCKAMCCRKKWNVVVSHREFQSDSYKIRVFCSSTNGNCENESLSCLYRNYRLKKKKDGSCIYLNDENKCSIYEKRPKICREFSCKEGWDLSSAHQPLADEKKGNNNKKSAGKYFVRNLIDQKLFFVDRETQKDFMKRLSSDILFILNPLERMEGLFYLKEKKKIIIFRRSINKCGTAIVQYKFHYPALDDKSLLYLINLFDGKNLFRDILQEINKKYGVDLTINDLHKIACLFYHNKIIIPKSPDNIPAILKR